MSDPQNTDSKPFFKRPWFLTVWGAVTAGLVVWGVGVWWTARHQGPSVVVVNWTESDSTPTRSASINYRVHNEGQKSGENCHLHWEATPPGQDPFDIAVSGGFGIAPNETLGSSLAAPASSRQVHYRDMPTVVYVSCGSKRFPTNDVTLHAHLRA